MFQILIIEDDQYVQNMLKQTFERAGYAVVLASNGREGLQRYKERPFHVVITDIIMPEMEGIETISALKKTNSEVKVIAISGGGRNNPDDYLYMAEKIGAARIFAKPVDRSALLDAVDELVAN